MAVYLLHFDRAYPNGSKPQHYIGYAHDIPTRLAEHRARKGARLLQVLADHGIGWTLVRTWPDGDRSVERRLKNWKKGAALCPVCPTPRRSREPQRRSV